MKKEGRPHLPFSFVEKDWKNHTFSCGLAHQSNKTLKAFFFGGLRAFLEENSSKTRIYQRAQ
jgi:hypothetical protein